MKVQLDRGAQHSQMWFRSYSLWPQILPGSTLPTARAGMLWVSLYLPDQRVHSTVQDCSATVEELGAVATGANGCKGNWKYVSCCGLSAVTMR